MDAETAAATGSGPAGTPDMATDGLPSVEDRTAGSAGRAGQPPNVGVACSAQMTLPSLV